MNVCVIFVQKLFLKNTDINWPSIPDEMSLEAADLIGKLLTPEPHQRIGYSGMTELKNHNFFKTIRWDSVLLQSMEDIFVPQPESMVDTFYFGEGFHKKMAVTGIEPVQTRKTRRIRCHLL